MRKCCHPVSETWIHQIPPSSNCFSPASLVRLSKERILKKKKKGQKKVKQVFLAHQTEDFHRSKTFIPQIRRREVAPVLEESSLPIPDSRQGSSCWDCFFLSLIDCSPTIGEYEPSIHIQPMLGYEKVR